MPSVWFSYAPESACVYHRALCPTRFCGPEFREKGWELLCGDGLPSGHDVYCLHGIPSPAGLYALMALKQKGAKIVWSVDDDYTSIPEWNPVVVREDDNSTFTILREMADFILTSTPHLASTFFDCGDRVLCAPNLLDVSRFPKPKTTEKDGQVYFTLEEKVKLPVHVLWAGGPTHKEDVAVLADCLDKLLDRIPPGRVAVTFFGMAPPAPLLTKYLHRHLFHQNQVPFAAYQQILNSVDPHVCLCPLSPVPFNLSKSAIRVMESWALCAAPVATDYGEYSLVRSGRDGRLVHTPDEWYSALHRMVTDHEFRRDCAAMGRLRVQDEHDWNDPKCREPWVKVFERLTGVTL